MNEDENLDLLDLDDGTSLDALPNAPAFTTPRPKKPWLLLGLGLVVIVLATYIIVRTISGDESSSVEIDLDAPAVVVEGNETLQVPNAPAQPVVAQPENVANAPQPIAVPQATVQPQPQPQPQPVATPDQNAGAPVRVVEDRKEVTFKPHDAEQKPAAKPQQAKPQQPKPVAKPQPKPKPTNKVSATNGAWYVQFGSYSTRAAAESAQRKIAAEHASLFSGHQFVILAAQMKDGTTKYRLRISFATSSDANSFCQNAKSDGLDCYVAK